MSRRHLVVGHSHVIALRQALIAGGERAPGGLEYEFVLLQREEAVILPTRRGQAPERLAENWRSPVFQERLATPSQDAEHVFLLWQGGQFALRMTVAVGGEFDFVLPTEEDPAPTPVPLVPYAVVEQWAEGVFNPMFDLVWEALAPQAAAGRVSFLTPAPPLPTAAVQQRLISSPAVLEELERTKNGLASTSLVADSVRAKAWKVMADAYERKAHELGCMLIRPPEAAFTETGMLPEAFWGNDVSHANGQYGRLYIDKISRAVAPRGVGAEPRRYSAPLS